MVLVSNKIDAEKPLESFSRVLGFFHRDIEASASFIRIYFNLPTVFHQTNNSNSFITLTPKHLIAVRDPKSNVFEYIPAENVPHGSELKYFDPKSNQPLIVQVVKTELIHIKNKGIYAPLTESGTIIVDDVYVSCFSMVKNHSFAQMFFSVLNLFNKYLLNVNESHDFISTCSRFFYEIVRTLHVEQLFLNVSVLIN
jgi:hypothetical protein